MFYIRDQIEDTQLNLVEVDEISVKGTKITFKSIDDFIAFCKDKNLNTVFYWSDYDSEIVITPWNGIILFFESE